MRAQIVFPTLFLVLCNFLVASRVISDAQDITLPTSQLYNLPRDLWSHPVTGVDSEELWQNSVARGTKLLKAMKGTDAEAATLYGLGTTAESPFDGDLVDELRKWGYNDNTPALQALYDKECTMDVSESSPTGHMLKPTFESLGLNTKSKGQNGANECFQVEHNSGPAVTLDDSGKMPLTVDQRYKVCEKEYRVTNSQHSMGVNAPGGAIFAISRTSAASAARRLWRRTALPEELPDIRSASDIAWAFWNRAVGPDNSEGIKNIKYFFSMMIINNETNKHIRRALSTLDPPQEEAPKWPGVEFTMETEAGKAMLGSPVGRWAGYFLMQHKKRLGGSKSIEKVVVFKSEKAGSLPYLLFYVGGVQVSKEGGQRRMSQRRAEEDLGVVSVEDRGGQDLGERVKMVEAFDDHIMRARL